MTSTRAPLHLGGPLGALGLGCFGGAVALTVAAINNEPPARVEPAGQTPPAMTVDIKSSPASPDRPVGAPGQPGTGLGGGGLPSREEGGVVVETAQADTNSRVAERPARAEGTEVHFIVRIKGATEVDIITRNFKRDPSAAQAAFQDLATRLPGLKDFTLVGASYSGEIKLAYQMPPGTAATPAEIRSVQDRLLKVEGVSYADPDYVAHPGKDTP